MAGRSLTNDGRSAAVATVSAVAVILAVPAMVVTALSGGTFPLVGFTVSFVLLSSVSIVFSLALRRAPMDPLVAAGGWRRAPAAAHVHRRSVTSERA